MLTKLTIINFKKFGKDEVELGNPVVFIGPNNSGKTSTLQALALWEVGLKRWNEKRKGKAEPKRRPGVTINRRDLVAIPVPNSNLLWRDLHVRDVQKVDGKQKTKNIRIDIIVEGVTEDKAWQCGLEFDYANEESFYCRPLRLSEGKNPERIQIPDEAGKVQVAFLPPMSGLSSNETRLDPGAINVRVGEGRTAEVLRNLCYKTFSEKKDYWDKLISHISSLFGSDLDPPEYIPERGEIRMRYRENAVIIA
ncbi:MAG: AAA family ATPase [Deltaproteobacteria bacterium]|nr:AAA family ATPase [Deltaproteobacteria bacterium]